MIFKNLRVNRWRQFDSVAIDFHPRATILTGVNGTGKTTLLSILALHFGWPMNVVSEPVEKRSGQGVRYVTGFLERLTSKPPNEASNSFGSITYGDNESAFLRVPTEVQFMYQVLVDGNVKQRNGMFIHSHRANLIPQTVDRIPMLAQTRLELRMNYDSLVRNRLLSTGGQVPFYALKESLISLAMFGYGNEAVEANPDSRFLFEKFQSVLCALLPQQIAFQRIKVRAPDVILETGTGSFSIDASSGGLAAIIEMAWQIFLFEPSEIDGFAVVIDEPENHLHPELQRTILPNLLEAFPSAQFIVATHNPLIASSVSDANLYVLDFDSEAKRVNSSKIELPALSGTSNDILRDIFGLRYSMPEWVASKLTEIVQKYRQQPLTEDSFARFRQELGLAGLDQYVPETLKKVLSNQKR